MKTLLFFISLLPFTANALQIDLCKYFSVNVAEHTKNDSTVKYIATTINRSLKDDFGKEINEHFWRYDYLLIKSFRNAENLKALYPDSFKIKTTFCEQLNNRSVFRENFELICPQKYLPTKIKPVKFSEAEMMFVAARFFYCNKVNKDTAIIPKICVGINGIKEMETTKDLTALEAFAFEAIFKAIKADGEPKIVNDFMDAVRNAMKARKPTIKDLDSFLIDVRNECFKEMEQNEALKKSLLDYYKSNKNTFNFTIQ